MYTLFIIWKIVVGDLWKFFYLFYILLECVLNDRFIFAVYSFFDESSCWKDMGMCFRNS